MAKLTREQFQVLRIKSEEALRSQKKQVLICGFTLGFFSCSARTERADQTSVPSAIPDRNCVIPASANAVICSVNTAFSATHRGSSSSYRHGNFRGRWPVKATAVLLSMIYLYLQPNSFNAE